LEKPIVWIMASIVWRKVRSSQAAWISLLLALGALALFAYSPDVGSLQINNDALSKGQWIVSALVILSVIFLGGPQIALEIQDRTALFWLAHPVRRWRFVAGKLLASCVLSWTLLLVLDGALAGLFAMRGVAPQQAFFTNTALLALKVPVFSALLTCLSTSLGYMGVAMIGGVLFLAGLCTFTLPYYAILMGSGPMTWLMWLMYWLIPNWQHFEYGMEISGTPTYWVLLVLYSIALSAVYLILAVISFQGRDIG
jgi:ABC-type transport system involved in multi-copper enzyme maturation permease subunit